MPLIKTPSKRVDVELIDPLSKKSDEGGRYVHLLVDCTTNNLYIMTLLAINTANFAKVFLGMFLVSVPYSK